jgi:hypothetical protein
LQVLTGLVPDGLQPLISPAVAQFGQMSATVKVDLTYSDESDMYNAITFAASSNVSQNIYAYLVDREWAQ